MKKMVILLVMVSLIMASGCTTRELIIQLKDDKAKSKGEEEIR